MGFRLWGRTESDTTDVTGAAAAMSRGASKPSIPTDPVTSPPMTDTKKLNREANKGFF